MAQVILYNDDNGKLCVLKPTQSALSMYSIEIIANKDVPQGLPYKIIDDSELPSDRLFRDAWEIDSSLLTDGIGSASNEFPEV